MEMGISGMVPHILLQQGSRLDACRMNTNQGIAMFTALDTFLTGFGVTAYVAAHAYVIFVLKAPAARAASDLQHQGDIV